MTDDQPTGSCPACARRDPHEPILCRVCRSKLRSWLADIPDLYSQLAATEYDGLAGSKAGGRVSGSKERRLPIDTDAVDLTGPVRSAGVAVLDEDATGYTSVASVLDFWVEDWRAFRRAGERRPSATVPEIVRWLLDRLDDAMDANPAIAEFYDAVRGLRGALKAQLGDVEVPDYKRGISCPRCLSLTLVHHSGSDRIECGSCPALLSFLEYDAHIRSLSAVQVQARRVKVGQIKALRSLLAAMRSAGWQRAARFEDADGKPVKRADRAYTVLTWWRGHERIEVWVAAGERAPHGSIYYTADDRKEDMFMSVHTDWAERFGAGAVQKLARAAGLLTPIKQEAAA